MDYKYNFSFIIPHKNLPELLRRCVSSIPKRDDVQIIIVDDNSDPEIVDFEHFPFLGDKNVEVIFDKSGKRQGHARNLGIDRAEGKWLIFADSDDFFFYSINKALDENVNSDVDIVHFKATVLNSETYLPYVKRCLPDDSVDRYLRGDKDGELYVRLRYPAPWGKLISSSLVREHNIRFAEIERLEDMQFSYQCGYYAKSIAVNDYSIYCYAQRPNTVTRTLESQSRLTLVKVDSDFMHFLSTKDLGNSPIYQDMKDDVFNNLEEMRKTQDTFYNQAIAYLKGLGFTNEFIDKNLKKQKVIDIKTSIAKHLSFIMRH